jgi:thiamine transporter ThiT
MEIKIINRENLDILWWNSFVEQSTNPLVFSLSYNLDVFYNKNWIILCILDNNV